MINLIPKKEKKAITLSFYYRLVILLLATLNICVLLVFVAILPSYFLSSVKNNIADVKLQTQKNEPMLPIDQEVLSAMQDLDNRLELAENAQKNTFLVSERAINTVVFKKMPGIKITKVFYENDSIKGRVIRIQGNAPSREVLLSFRRALEDDVSFRKVDLPISNFVKGSNIQFSLNLTLQ